MCTHTVCSTVYVDVSVFVSALAGLSGISKWVVVQDLVLSNSSNQSIVALRGICGICSEHRLILSVFYLSRFHCIAHLRNMLFASKFRFIASSIEAGLHCAMKLHKRLDGELIQVEFPVVS